MRLGVEQPLRIVFDFTHSRSERNEQKSLRATGSRLRLPQLRLHRCCSICSCAWMNLSCSSSHVYCTSLLAPSDSSPTAHDGCQAGPRQGRRVQSSSVKSMTSMDPPPSAGRVAGGAAAAASSMPRARRKEFGDAPSTQRRRCFPDAASAAAPVPTPAVLASRFLVWRPPSAAAAAPTWLARTAVAGSVLRRPTTAAPPVLWHRWRFGLGLSAAARGCPPPPRS